MKITAIIKRDLQTYTRSKIKLLSLFVAILLPLAYGFLYLWAFWNPYDNMKNVPIAVVNEDVGTMREGEMENYGEKITEELKNSNVLDWNFTKRKDAENGLDQQKYYAIILIPQTFSSDLVSSTEENPRQAKIEWQTRDSTNFLFTTYFKNVISALGKKINENMLPEFSEEAQVKLEEITNKLGQAGEGAKALDNGLEEIENGSQTLSENLDKAERGSQNLTNGLETLDSKSNELQDGISKLRDGSAQLNTGLESANSGAESLSEGLADINDGAKQLKTGSIKMKSATRKLANGTEELNTKIESVDESLSPLYPFFENINDFIEKINSDYNLYIPNYISNTREQKEALLSGTEEIAEGSNTIADKMSDLDEGIGTLETGINAAQGGADTLSNGVNRLSEGSEDLHQGIINLQDGTKRYTDGVNSAYYGSQELSDGLYQLSSGSKQLAEGILKAQDGANTLSAGLEQGQERIEEELTPNKIEALMEIINEPVGIKNTSTDANQTYGAGFAPYFVPLALWMGALILTLLVPTRDPKLNISEVSKIEMTIGKFFLLALVGTAQAITLCTSLIYGLGLKAKYPFAFILFTILISLTFISIMQLFSFLFGKIGELIGIVFLMVQLTSASGTFPVQSAPHFFQFCSPFMPMTYAVRALRLLILGGNMDIAIQQAKTLLVFLFLFLAAKTITTPKTIRATDIYPLIEL